MNKNSNYQDQALNIARKENITVIIFLISGFQIKGFIRAFDQYVVLLEVDGRQQMVYKHAISTIIPSKNLRLDFDSEE